jgi:hypothetical protein
MGRKGLTDFPNLSQYRDDLGPGKYDWYRCYKCSRVITREQELAFYGTIDIKMEEDVTSGFCICGSLKCYPLAKPVGLEWLRWPTLRYTLKLVLARGLAPWCDRHFRPALPMIEKLVRLKEA